ncbi:MAG: flavin reductase family protein [Anaerolineae bacterium]
MAKRVQKPFPALYPIPVVLVTCLDEDNEPNVLTVAWIGTVSSTPPQIAISVRPYRYSHALIRETGEFVVNIPTEDLLHAVDYCGRISKSTRDKFADTGLTPEPASQVRVPIIGECPVNIECKVVESVSLGSHDLFVGEIVAVHVDEELLDEEGFIDYVKAKAVAYLGNEYWSLGERLESSGFTMRGS